MSRRTANRDTSPGHFASPYRDRSVPPKCPAPEVPTVEAARRADLNEWHRTIHQVTGDMALRFNKATAADLERWAKMLRGVAEEMETVAKP
jgi:hypothetical protein